MFDATISTQVVTVYILNDSVVEDTEFFNLALTSEDSAVMLNPATATINIEDMDSKLTNGKCMHFCSFHDHSIYIYHVKINGVCLYSTYSMGCYKFRT